MTEPIGSAGFTQREIDQLRANQESFMGSLCEIHRKISMGDSHDEIGPIASDIPCRLVPGFGVWRQVADKFQGIKAYTFTMPWDTDLKAGDEVYDAYGRQYLVRDVSSSSTYLTCLRSLMEAIDE